MQIIKKLLNDETQIKNDSQNTSNRYISKPRCFTIYLLNDKLKSDAPVLIGEYHKLSRKSKITFICNCGEQHTKNILVILDKGGAISKNVLMLK
jgi:hypothetical protein